ncbi:MAG: FliM/FliN family flagellar motor C-terminal domain-containing protein [Phycisphaerae bacterium]|nr:FliM/FliN family flagellar motor C-terminal domain-containing protein [Phycisphaerae bacterium]
MTQAGKNITLSRNQLRDVLAAARDNAPVEENDLEVFDYDWRRPRQFNDTHHVMLSQFCKQLAGDLAELFSEMCSGPSRVSIPRVKEYYCDGIRKEFCDEKKNYYIVFVDKNNREVGVLILPHLSAIQWTAKMLGDTDPEISDNYEMSNLEESLLIDLSENLLRKFSDSLVKNELAGIRCLPILSDRDWPIECLGYDEFTLLQLQVEHSESSVEASMFILSSYFGPMLEINFPDERQSNNQQLKNAVISNLKKIPIEVDVLLGKATVAVSNLMILAEGDVIVLDRKAGEPVEALIEGKVFFHGFPAKTSNRYALAVSGMMEPGEELNNE